MRYLFFISMCFLGLQLGFSQGKITSFEKGVRKSERIIKRLLRKKKIPGIAITVTKSGNTVYQKGFGYADITKKTPIDPKSTLFRVASVSKPLSAMGLATLVAQGKIDLDKTVLDYLPDFPETFKAITIAHLAGHLSGIRSYKGSEYQNNKPLSIKEGISLFKNDALLHTPGTRFYYSSYNWNLLSYIIETITKQPFDQYMRQNVLQPLQMKNTFSPNRAIALPNKTVFYKRKGARGFALAPPVENQYKLAGGGFLATSADIARLGNGYLQNSIASPMLLERLTTSLTLPNGAKTYYGLGWQASYDAASRVELGHVGNGIGGYAFFYVYPEKELVFSILINVTNPKQDKKLRLFIENLIQATDFL